MRHRGLARALGFVVLSLGAHLAIALTMRSTVDAPPDTDRQVARVEERATPDVVIEGASRLGTEPPVAHVPSPVAAGGVQSVDNVDDRSASGGADAQGAEEVVLLVAHESARTMTDSVFDHPSANQIQRIDTSDHRSTQEDRRATPNPALDRTVTNGVGSVVLRTPNARANAQRGEASRDPEEAAAARAQSLGTSGGAAAVQLASRAATARGLVSTDGQQANTRAATARQRPDVDPGPAATLADDRRVEVADDRDAQLLVSSMMESMVDASERHGRANANGNGTGGATGEGNGGARVGRGRARAYAEGVGDGGAAGARYTSWFRDQRARVERNLDFPRERAIEMDQGTSVIRMRIDRSGALAMAPAVIRTSGFADLDHAALRAVRAAAPFAPIPDDVAPGSEALEVVMPVAFANPMVR